MSHATEFSSLIRELQYTTGLKKNTLLKNITAALQEPNNNVIQELLEHLVSTNDIEIKIKLFSVLATSLIHSSAHYEVIVKFNPLYDIVQSSLMQSSPMKTAGVLNFVSALLLARADCARGLATHARNMLRVSGCLNTMSGMFSSSMMYHDTWIALCQSLAATCRGSEINQNYCAHLVSMCVKRCLQGNVDVCTVLQSLLQNHEQNIQLLIESGGLDIFTRSVLQYNMGMQLLNTIVEKSPVAVSMLRTTDVVHHLRDFLRLYGPRSQMGQWSTIILYHLDKAGNCTAESFRQPCVENKTKNISTHTARTTQKWFKQPTNDVTLRNRESGSFVEDKIEKQRSAVNYGHKLPPTITDITNNDQIVMSNQEDTARLFQNVIKEVFHFKSEEIVHSEKPFHFNSINKRACDLRNQTEPTKRIQNQMNVTKRTSRQKVQEEDLTFSFLMNKTSHESPKYYRRTKDGKMIESIRSPSHLNNATSYDKEVQTNNSLLYSSVANNNSIIDSTFRPPFISTPKRDKKNENVSKITLKSNSSTISRKNQGTRFRTKSIGKPREKKEYESKNTKQRSMSERFFRAINESCTTIVKGVKNIFMAKGDRNDQNRTEDNGKNASCSYSFTNYMRRRDALLEGEFSRNDESSSGYYKVNSCKTCKDTIVLQQKMKGDNHLKQTVRKLKMGINLYGCDFKKISYAMWPRDRYMTPDMLHNLYRKLIVKGGHKNHSFRLKTDNIIRKR